jgi:hypothetical protein
MERVNRRHQLGRLSGIAGVSTEVDTFRRQKTVLNHPFVDTASLPKSVNFSTLRWQK